MSTVVHVPARVWRDQPSDTSLQGRIIAALVANAAMLALPRWRVLADIVETYRCGSSTARAAYAAALTKAHARVRRELCRQTPSRSAA